MLYERVLHHLLSDLLSELLRGVTKKQPNNIFVFLIHNSLRGIK